MLPGSGLCSVRELVLDVSKLVVFTSAVCMEANLKCFNHRFESYVVACFLYLNSNMTDRNWSEIIRSSV